MLVRNLVFYCSLLSAFVAHSSLSLDTIEPFESGLSDLELYYGQSASLNHAVMGTVGIGINRFLNPAISPEMLHDGQAAWGMGFENIMNLYEGRVGVDVIPGIWTNLNENILGIGVELTLPFEGFTPYLQSRASTHLEDNSFDYVASLGAAMTVMKGGELFLEVGHKWLPGTDVVRAGIGFNLLLGESTEMVSQLTHEEEWGAMFGVIQSL